MIPSLTVWNFLNFLACNWSLNPRKSSKKDSIAQKLKITSEIHKLIHRKYRTRKSSVTLQYCNNLSFHYSHNFSCLGFILIWVKDLNHVKRLTICLTYSFRWHNFHNRTKISEVTKRTWKYFIHSMLKQKETHPKIHKQKHIHDNENKFELIKRQ